MPLRSTKVRLPISCATTHSCSDATTRSWSASPDPVYLHMPLNFKLNIPLATPAQTTIANSDVTEVSADSDSETNSITRSSSPLQPSDSQTLTLHDGSNSVNDSGSSENASGSGQIPEHEQSCDSFHTATDLSDQTPANNTAPTAENSDNQSTVSRKANTELAAPSQPAGPSERTSTTSKSRASLEAKVQA